MLLAYLTSHAEYIQLTDGVYQDSTTVFISSNVTSLEDLNINPSIIYCYATTPPTCNGNTFSTYDATLHVPSTAMISYFTTQYWNNFNYVSADAIEPQFVTLSQTDVAMELGTEISFTSSVIPSNATPTTIETTSTDPSVACVSGSIITAMGIGECDIIATCVDKQAICHVTVTPIRININLDKHNVRLLPNQMITLAATCSPTSTDLVISSSNPNIALPRMVNDKIMVLGISEGTATITVNAADGWGNPDSCLVTVYTKLGDINSDGSVSISDITTLIDYLLGDNSSVFNSKNADTNLDGKISIGDVTALIDYLLIGNWPWDIPQTENFTVNGVTFTMVSVKGGTFTMGATLEQGSGVAENEKPEHDVTLSDYVIGQTEVTQELWQAVMDCSPSTIVTNSKCPIENVSWNDCQVFIARLNKITGKKFRLPTEAEWEFAARGGNNSKGFKYAGSNDINQVAWNSNNSNSTTHPVGNKAANELNLFDMSGNVREWCQDWYGDYSSEAQINPRGPKDSSYHFSRGGGFADDDNLCRSSCRITGEQDSQGHNTGLRLALDLDLDSTKFHLSESVIEIEDGELLSVDILNGCGSYTIFSDNENLVRIEIKDNKLIMTGMSEGSVNIMVKDSTTQVCAFITAVVDPVITETYEITSSYNNSITESFTLVKVSGGTFTMGATEEQGSDPYEYEYPVHQVTLSSYYIAETEVTQRLWKAVMNNTPSAFYNEKYPVYDVSWNDCKTFIQKLNSITGKQFRLPTEAEWEFAARGGNKSRGYKYSGSDNIYQVARFSGNSTEDHNGYCTVFPSTVAKYAANELGLYDMSGNVYEWCQDWYGNYSGGSQTNPSGPSSGTHRVIRGGCYWTSARGCRVSFRRGVEPHYASSGSDRDRTGLRLVLDD